VAVARVAVVDDSVFIRKALKRILDKNDAIDVVGVAASGEELLEALDEWCPDVITLDLSMPGIGGLQTLDRVRERCSTPIIILSTHSQRDAPQTIEALHRGAVDFIDKQMYSLVDFQALGNVLIEKIVLVTDGVDSMAPKLEAPTPPKRMAVPPRWHGSPGREYEVLLIGASTGGPLAMQRVLDDLGGDFPLPIVVVQHMPEGFTAAFAARLNSHLAMSVREAVDGESLVVGSAYIAPAGRHAVFRDSNRLCVRLVDDPQTPHRPSIDVLFHSAAEILGSRVIAALLTGMGRDGAAGMVALREAGSHTVAQDADTSVIYGMPGAAVAAGGARESLALSEIGAVVRGLAHGSVAP